MADQNEMRPLTLPEVFPPGPRRRMLLHLANHPEYDQPEWKGQISYRRFCYKDGTPGISVDVHPAEENLDERSA